MKNLVKNIVISAMFASVITPAVAMEKEHTATQIENNTPLISEQAQEDFFQAVIDENLDAIEKTLAAGANPNLPIKPNITPLIFAVKRNNLQMTHLLIAMGADPNLTVGSPKVTPLTFAVRRGNVAMAQLLITLGADPNLNPKDRLDWKPLIIAVENNDLVMIRLLLSGGADPDTYEFEDEKTVLMTATLTNPKIVQLLIAKGANIEKKDEEWGWTALMLAAQRGSLEAAQLLLDAGANIIEKNNLNDEALTIAEDNNRTTLATLIRNKRQQEVVETIIEKTEKWEFEIPTDIANLISKCEC